MESKKAWQMLPVGGHVFCNSKQNSPLCLLRLSPHWNSTPKLLHSAGACLLLLAFEPSLYSTYSGLNASHCSLSLAPSNFLSHSFSICKHNASSLLKVAVKSFSFHCNYCSTGMMNSLQKREVPLLPLKT